VYQYHPTNAIGVGVMDGNTDVVKLLAWTSPFPLTPINAEYANKARGGHG